MTGFENIIEDMNKRIGKLFTNSTNFIINEKPAGIYVVSGITVLVVGTMIYTSKDNSDQDTSLSGVFGPYFQGSANSQQQTETDYGDEEQPPIEEETNYGDEEQQPENNYEDEPKSEPENNYGDEPPMENEYSDGEQEAPPKEDNDVQDSPPPEDDEEREKYGGKSRRRRNSKKKTTLKRH
jgi:hypothetical protein